MPETKISWLHLTDLHHGQKEGWQWPTMRQQFFDDLSKLSEDAGPWDIVFFSGDLVQKGSKDEFAGLTEELVELWKHFSALGSNPYFLCVPGNHDLKRPEATSTLASAARNWHKPAEKTMRTAFWEDCKSSIRTEINATFDNYLEWTSQVPLPKPSLKHGIIAGDFSTIISIREIELGVIGLNTTFLQLCNHNHKKNLDLHPNQLFAVCGNNPADWRSKVDVAVLMTHQPSEWFHATALANYHEMVRPHKFSVHLSGHLHNSHTQDTSTAGFDTIRVRQAPSLFGLGEFGRKAKRIFGYQSGRLDIDKNDETIKETLWPRLASRKHPAGMDLGPDSNYNLSIRCSIETTYRTKLRKTDKTGADIEIEAVTSNLQSTPLVIGLDKSVDIGTAQKKLLNVPRLKYIPQPHHRVVRLEERKLLNQILNNKRLVWLISDWGMGMEGFVFSAIENSVDESAVSHVYRFQCGGATDLASLMVSMEQQIGMSFQEFCAAISVFPSSTIIFDDLPSILTDNSGEDEVSKTIKPILDFCPFTRLIFVSRVKPSTASDADCVQLKALSLYETPDYIHHHPQTRSGLRDSDNLERIQNWSEGLPMHLDRLLERLEYVSLDDIIYEDIGASSLQANSAPQSLKDAVARISDSVSNEDQRSFRLLKILTVLRDGETFDTIRRFDAKKPFHDDDIKLLGSLNLVEAIPVSSNAIELTRKALTSSRDEASTQKLLRVPRHVRDYVGSLILEEERLEIIRSSAGLFFGRDWWKEKIRLRTALYRIYNQSSLTAPGNEDVVARNLLQSALGQNNSKLINRYASLAVAYCSRLIAADRFKDTSIAAAGIYNLLKDTTHDEYVIEIAHIYARALRMTGRAEDAITILTAAIHRGKDILIKENEAGMWLTLGFSYDSAQRPKDATECAIKVLELVHIESSDAYQARNIIADNNLTGHERIQALSSLHTKARNLRHTMAANNIALKLAREGSSIEDSIKLLDTVIRTATDPYNKTRGIVEKATRLAKNHSISQLTDSERDLLNAAYSYSYSQRVGDLFDRCHSVLWSMLIKEKLWTGILRLFRYSSFIWRLKGTESKETEYLEQLNGVDIADLKQNSGTFLIYEINYLEERRQQT